MATYICLILLAVVISCKADFSVDVHVQTDNTGTKITKTITSDSKGTRIYHANFCGDDYALCGYWAMFGECHSNSNFMHTSCKWTCGLCGTVTCEDKSTQCKYWAATGECQSNPNYMLKNCRMSCEVCNPGCRDQHRYCRDWAEKGECTNNPGYMHKKCPWSCWTC